MDSVQDRYEALKKTIASYKSVLIAFSGGTDSALIAKVARDVLGRKNIKAVTSWSDSFPRSEIKEVRAFVECYDIPHEWIDTGEIENPRYADNPKERCFFCKSELYDYLLSLAGQWQIDTIVNGAQMDDLDDWRPGLEAAKRYNIKSPLMEAGFHKQDVRNLSRILGLSTWDKPAAACLASRIPHGERVTAGKLRQIEEGEGILKAEGFRVVRLRHFGRWARIEVSKEELSRLLSDLGFRGEIISKIKNLGFERVEIDPEGYRQGKLHAPMQHV